MMKALRISFVALIASMAWSLFLDDAQAQQAPGWNSKHNCNFCHSLHGGPVGDAVIGGSSGSGNVSSSLVPLDSPTNMEVLCLSCHWTFRGGADEGTATTKSVASHRSDGGYPDFRVGCTDCHNKHGNMPNWRGSHTDTGNSTVDAFGWTEGYNSLAVGREP